MKDQTVATKLAKSILLQALLHELTEKRPVEQAGELVEPGKAATAFIVDVSKVQKNGTALEQFLARRTFDVKGKTYALLWDTAEQLGEYQHADQMQDHQSKGGKLLPSQAQKQVITPKAKVKSFVDAVITGDKSRELANDTGILSADQAFKRLLSQGGKGDHNHWATNKADLAVNVLGGPVTNPQALRDLAEAAIAQLNMVPKKLAQLQAASTPDVDVADWKGGADYIALKEEQLAVMRRHIFKYKPNNAPRTNGTVMDRNADGIMPALEALTGQLLLGTTGMYPPEARVSAEARQQWEENIIDTLNTGLVKDGIAIQAKIMFIPNPKTDNFEVCLYEYPYINGKKLHKHNITNTISDYGKANLQVEKEVRETGQWLSQESREARIQQILNGSDIKTGFGGINK